MKCKSCGRRNRHPQIDEHSGNFDERIKAPFPSWPASQKFKAWPLAESKRTVQVGFQNRSGPYAASARDHIANGKLRRIIHVKVYNMLDSSNWEPKPDSEPPAALHGKRGLGRPPKSASG